MTAIPYQLSLFRLEEGISILFNPESRASCTVSDAGIKSLLTLPNVPGSAGEITLLISQQKVDHPGPFRSLFQALKVGQCVPILPEEKFAFSPDDVRQIPQKVIVYPALACNLRCRYCWNAWGTYGRSDMPMMSRQTASRTGRWIASLIASSDDQDEGVQEIEFFGGEPLLAPDAFRIITELVCETARKQGRKITILLQTNGLLLTPDLIHFCKEHQVRISISLDGPTKNHDAMRITAKQSGSHQQVVEAIQRGFSIYPEGISIRATLVPPYDVFGAYDYFHSLRVPDKAVEIARVLPYRFTRNGQIDYDKSLAWSPSRPYWHRFLVEYLHRLQTQQGVYFIKSVFGTLNSAVRPIDRRKTAPCDFGIVSPAVLPDGTLIPCYFFAFDPSVTLGDITGGINPDKTMAVMKQVPSSVGVSEPCRTCFARYLCGGPCYARSKARTGSMAGFNDITCDIDRESFISNFFTAALWAQKDPQFIQKLKANQGADKEKDKLLLETLFARHYLKEPVTAETQAPVD